MDAPFRVDYDGKIVASTGIVGPVSVENTKINIFTAKEISHELSYNENIKNHK
jgi:hypothetical protein